MCRMFVHELSISDRKDYSSLLKLGLSQTTDCYVCVSSGTAEMRAAGFLLTAFRGFCRQSCCKSDLQPGRSSAGQMSIECEWTRAIGKRFNNLRCPRSIGFSSMKTLQCRASREVG